jgi:3-deoxy-7-phosphoheptulonate synthase
MIVVMRRDASEQDIQHMIKEVEAANLKPTVLRGTERTVIAVIGDERKMASIGALESGPGVDEVLTVLAPYKVASRETKSEPTIVKAGSLTVGGGHLGIIAGPCGVESEEQIISAAHAIKKAGATALRGGAFKPRTSPYSFQGMKEAGLKLLAKARAETGLAVVTEVVASEDVPMVAEYADVLQVGARNMQNYRLLEAVGRVTRPVLLKRGPSATMDEFLLAAE